MGRKKSFFRRSAYGICFSSAGARPKKKNKGKKLSAGIGYGDGFHVDVCAREIKKTRSNNDNQYDRRVFN